MSNPEVELRHLHTLLQTVTQEGDHLVAATRAAQTGTRAIETGTTMQPAFGDVAQIICPVLSRVEHCAIHQDGTIVLVGNPVHGKHNTFVLVTGRIDTYHEREWNVIDTDIMQVYSLHFDQNGQGSLIALYSKEGPHNRSGTLHLRVGERCKMITDLVHCHNDQPAYYSPPMCVPYGHNLIGLAMIPPTSEHPHWHSVRIVWPICPTEAPCRVYHYENIRHPIAFYDGSIFNRSHNRNDPSWHDSSTETTLYYGENPITEDAPVVPGSLYYQDGSLMWLEHDLTTGNVVKYLWSSVHGIRSTSRIGSIQKQHKSTWIRNTPIRTCVPGSYTTLVYEHTDGVCLYHVESEEQNWYTEAYLHDIYPCGIDHDDGVVLHVRDNPAKRGSHAQQLMIIESSGTVRTFDNTNICQYQRHELGHLRCQQVGDRLVMHWRDDERQWRTSVFDPFAQSDDLWDQMQSGAGTDGTLSGFFADDRQKRFGIFLCKDSYLCLRVAGTTKSNQAILTIQCLGARLS